MIKKTHKYRDLPADGIEELFSHFLISSVSNSKRSCFARNEKAFEMQYLYLMPMKFSANTVAGQAYHAALQLFFDRLRDGETCDVVDMNCKSYDHIIEQPATSWKIQKTTPFIEDCVTAATNVSQTLILNFLKEQEVYTSEIKEILGVELKIKTWITVNGVDIPLPLNAVLDLVVITNDGKRVIIDHKSKRSFSDKSKAVFVNSKQAITYVLAYEAEYGENIDEVWFIENKYSKNRDASIGQLSEPIKLVMDHDSRRLYEAQMYDSLKRMLEAVSNPDYVYLINEMDTLVDLAEINDFWCLTMLGEIDDFNIPDDKKPLIKERLRKIKDTSIASISPTVITNFKKYTEQFIPFDLTYKNMSIEQKIEATLRSFNISSEVKHKFDGYSSTSYLIEVGAGTQMSKIFSHRLDIANALNVTNVRINKNLFVYEDKSYLAVESVKRNTEVLKFDESKLEGQKIPLGIDNFKQTILWDINNPTTPHMLVGGATGSGKSVFITSIIRYALLAGVKGIIIFDQKKYFAHLHGANGIQVFSKIEDIELQMMILVEEMNNRINNGEYKKTLIIFDEYAMALSNSREGNDLKNYTMVQVGSYKDGRPKMKREVSSIDKSLSQNLQVLLQTSRSTGMNILAATQRASTKIINGDTKVNFPVQVCFLVPKDTDSMVMIDEPGAEALNGNGDGLINSPEYLGVQRFQGFYAE